MSQGLVDHIHIYVDASSEAGGYSGIFWHSLCVNTSGEVAGLFSEKVLEKFLFLVQGSDKQTAILELEMMIAISIAVQLWQSLMSTKRVFIRNDPVRSSIIKGNSQNQFAERALPTGRRAEPK